MKKLGVIGGLGPMATAYFMQLLVEMSDADSDQDHMEILLHSMPQIPDRTRYILGKSKDNPLPAMVKVGQNLVRQGAEVIAIPCITAHFFQQKLEEKIGAPILNGIKETVLVLQSNGITRIGLMATDGTIQSRIFQDSLEDSGISCVLPTQECQQQVMHLIYQDVKAGKPMEMPLFEQAAEQLFQDGAQVILLGCTELSLIKRDYRLKPEFLDVMEVLARKAVHSCGRLKPKYDKLITE